METLRFLPLKVLSSSFKAFSKDSLSENSIYPNLHVAYYKVCEVCTKNKKFTIIKYPFAEPVILSHIIVTRFIVPQEAKCARNSSAVAS